MNSNEYEEGNQAAFSGLEITKNPYDQHTEAAKFTDWQTGWTDGDLADNDPELADPSADVELELGSVDDDPSVLDADFDADTDDDDLVHVVRDEGLIDEY